LGLGLGKLFGGKPQLTGNFQKPPKIRKVYYYLGKVIKRKGFWNLAGLFKIIGN